MLVAGSEHVACAMAPQRVISAVPNQGRQVCESHPQIPDKVSHCWNINNRSLHMLAALPVLQAVQTAGCRAISATARGLFFAA